MREKLARAGFEERDLRWRLKEQEALLDVAAGVFERSRRPSCCLAVPPRGGERGRRRLFDARVMLLAAQSERVRQIPRADEHDVDTGSSGNGVDVFHG